MMREVDHPHIIRLFCTYETHKHIYLVTELCNGGNLFQVLNESNGRFTEKIGSTLMKQMLQAVNYLHTHGICHRDLKPDNFLLADKTDIDKAHIKLIDFGTAKLFKSGEAMVTKIATVHYVAPEILSKEAK